MTDNERRPLKNRPRERNFRFADYSKPQSKAPKDDKTINRKGPQVELVRPKWNGVAPMTFRPLPMCCAEDPSRFDKTRLTTDDYDFSDFWRGLPAVKYVGIDQKFTFLAYNPQRCDEEGYNPRTDNPYHVLYNAVVNAVKHTGEAIVNGRDVMTGKWSPLVNDGPMKAFSAPTKLYFLQGLIYESDNELYIKNNSLPKGLNKDDLPQIIEISKSAGDALAKKLNMLNPEYNGDTSEENQHEMYLYGDIVDLAYGSFLTLFNPDKHNNVLDAYEDPDAESSDEKDSWQSWGVAINPLFSYINRRVQTDIPGDVSEYESIIRSKIVPWDDILYFPPDEEIALWLAQAFRSQPAMLEFGWSDNPEFFTDEVSGILANRVQVSTADAVDDEEPQQVKRPQQSAKPVRPTQPQQTQRPAATKSAMLSNYKDVIEDEAPAAPVKPVRPNTAKAAPPPVVEQELYDEDYEEEEVVDEVVEDTEDVVEDIDAELVDADATDDVEAIEDEEVVDEIEDISEEAEEAALAAIERAKMRSATTKVGPTGPPPTKAKVATKPVVAKKK